MSGPVMYGDLKPRRKTVQVGDLDMTVREMVLQKWERFMAALATAVNWAELLKPLGAALRKANANAGETAAPEGGSIFTALVENVDALEGSFKTLVRDFLGKNIPELVLVALDSPENDAIAPAPADVVERIRGRAAQYAWENLTLRQSAALLDAVLDVNDVEDILGKFGGLKRRMAAALRLAPETPVMPPPAAPAG